MMFVLWYLLIGAVLSIGVAAYTYFTRRAHVFDVRRTAFVFLVGIPVGWPYILFLMAQDLILRKRW